MSPYRNHSPSLRLAFCALFLTAVHCGAPFDPDGEGGAGVGTTALSGGTVHIEWSMPDMFGGDADGDGLVDLVPTAPSDPSLSPVVGHPLRPVGWKVQVDGCGSTSVSSPISSYAWSISAPSLPEQQYSPATECLRELRVPALGVYSVKLTIRLLDGSQIQGTETIDVKNHVIVSIGDSIASGEGAPDAPALYAPQGGWRPTLLSAERWNDRRCHRSAKSGHAQAALALERSDRHSSVRFIALACSGATISDVVNGGYAGIEPPPGAAPLPSQLEAARQLLCPPGTESTPCPAIDTLLVNVGANDIGFGEIVKDCANPFTTCVGDDTAQATLAAESVLGARYDDLDNAIRNTLNVKDIYFGEYMDPTHTDSGAYCMDMTFRGALSDKWWGFDVFGEGDGRIDNVELVWAHDWVLQPLNAIGRAAARRHGWRYTGGVAAAFATHGYCALDHWIVRYEESKHDQRTEHGTMHPNAAGYSRIAVTFLNAAHARWASTANPYYVKGDVTRDRRADVQILGASAASVTIANAAGNGTFTLLDGQVTAGDGNIPLYSTYVGARPVAGDYDGDGISEFALTSGLGWWTIPVAFSRGDGTYRGTNEPVTSGDVVFPSYAAAAHVTPLPGDYDGDGKSDIALTGGNGWWTLPVAFSRGDGTFRPTNGPVTSGDSNIPWYATMPGAQPLSGDFDGDGRSDIALTGGIGWWTIPVALSNGDGTFRGSNHPVTFGDTTFPTLAATAGVTAVSGDFDADGRTDIALAGTAGRSTPVAFSIGDGTFRVTNWISDATNFSQTSRPVAGDFDGDGKTDIAFFGVRYFGGTGVLIAYSKGDGTFAARASGLSAELARLATMDSAKAVSTF